MSVAGNLSTRRYAPWWIGSVLALLGQACTATAPDARFVCSRDTECPNRQRCYDGLCRYQPLPPAILGDVSSTDDQTAGSAGSSDPLQSIAGVSAPPISGTGVTAPSAGMGSAGIAMSGSGSMAGKGGADPNTAGRAAPIAGHSPVPIDPCAENPCDAHAQCSASGMTAVCKCISPYIGDGRSCKIDSTCSTLNCSPHAMCVVTGTAVQCRCLDGYNGDGTNCVDVDECTGRPCDPNASCTNSPGSFSCRCKDGYSGTGMTCADDDECARQAVCDFNASCTNSPGSYSCRCKTGYEGDGFTCTAHDYCSPNPCAHGRCDSTSTGYRCDCSGTGYEGQRCEIEVDNCNPNPCSSHAFECHSSPGGFRCNCYTGYSGTRCEVDWCDSVNCPAGQKCIPAWMSCTAACHPNCGIGQTCTSSDNCTSKCCGGTTGMWVCQQSSWCGN